MHRRATASLTGAYTPIRLQEGLRLRFSAKDPLNSAFLDGGRANTRRWVCRGTARPCVVGRHQLSQRSSTLSSPPLTRWVCVGGGWLCPGAGASTRSCSTATPTRCRICTTASRARRCTCRERRAPYSCLFVTALALSRLCHPPPPSSGRAHRPLHLNRISYCEPRWAAEGVEAA
jgi:hypothetical protein